MLEPVSLYSIIKFENLKGHILYFLILKIFTALVTTSRYRPMARACFICLKGVIVSKPTRGSIRLVRGLTEVGQEILE